MKYKKLHSDYKEATEFYKMFLFICSKLYFIYIPKDGLWYSRGRLYLLSVGVLIKLSVLIAQMAIYAPVGPFYSERTCAQKPTIFLVSWNVRPEDSIAIEINFDWSSFVFEYFR